MHIALLSPVAWRTPPRQYGPWENVVSLLAEGLVAQGIQVTLFASGDSLTQGQLQAVCARGYEEDPNVLPKVAECLHIASLFERGDEFDLIHNHFDFLPLTYSAMTSTPLVTTIHGFSSPKILPVYEKYQHQSHYIAISDADRAPSLHYLKTIHHGIDLNQFSFQPNAQDYLLFFGRIHHDKGAKEAIDIAKATGIKLIMAGIIQDHQYYLDYVAPKLAPGRIEFIGQVGGQARDRLLGGAKALLHPIQFAEPFGLSVIEAMACGTPVVAYNRGSMAEIIHDGYNGFLVQDAQQAVEAIYRLPTIDRYNCRAHIQNHFSVQRMVNDYIGVYEQLISTVEQGSQRPWGHYQILADNPSFKVKEITVLPGKRLSLQRHQRRAEHWLIIEGQGVATVNDHQFKLHTGDSVDISIGSVHRIENSSTEQALRFVEVQTGSYFGEDDIERLEDDYGRV